MASYLACVRFSTPEKAYAALFRFAFTPGAVVKPQQRLYFLPEPQGQRAFRGVDFGAGAAVGAGLQNELLTIGFASAKAASEGIRPESIFDPGVGGIAGGAGLQNEPMPD